MVVMGRQVLSMMVKFGQGQVGHTSHSHAVRPPDMGLLKIKNNLSIYIASLRLRIGGVQAALQGDVIMMHTPAD